MRIPRIPLGVLIICIIFSIIGALWGSHAAGIVNLTPILKELPFIGDSFVSEEDANPVEISPLEEENADLKKIIHELEKKVIDLEAAEAQYLADIEKYKNLVSDLENKIEVLESKEEKTIKMAEFYSQMKPKEIAPIFENLDDSKVLDILLKLDADLVAGILAELDPLRAAKLSNLFTDN